MVFFLNLLVSILYADIVDRVAKENNFSIRTQTIYLTPLMMVWLIICGGQYYVGTDYPSYIKIFSGEGLEYFRQYGEFLFYYTVKTLNNIGLKGQSLYYIFYAIGFIFFLLIIKDCDIRKTAVFIALFIIITSIFNNQLNILRQAIMVYIGSYAGILAIKGKKKKALFYILLCTFFHLSSFILLIFLLPNRIIDWFSKKKMLWLFLGCVGLGIAISPSIINTFSNILPTQYAWYLQKGDVNEAGFLVKVTKFIYLPLYLLAILDYEKYGLSSFQKRLFIWGILGTSLRFAVLNIDLVNRLSMFFLIFSIIPIYQYMVYLIQRRKALLTYFIYGFLILTYAMKVLAFPTGEYDYKSIYSLILGF